MLQPVYDRHLRAPHSLLCQVPVLVAELQTLITTGLIFLIVMHCLSTGRGMRRNRRTARFAHPGPSRTNPACGADPVGPPKLLTGLLFPCGANRILLLQRLYKGVDVACNLPQKFDVRFGQGAKRNPESRHHIHTFACTNHTSLQSPNMQTDHYETFRRIFDPATGLSETSELADVQTHLRQVASLLNQYIDTASVKSGLTLENGKFLFHSDLMSYSNDTSNIFGVVSITVWDENTVNNLSATACRSAVRACIGGRVPNPLYYANVGRAYTRCNAQTLSDKELKGRECAVNFRNVVTAVPFLLAVHTKKAASDWLSLLANEQDTQVVRITQLQDAFRNLGLHRSESLDHLQAFVTWFARICDMPSSPLADLAIHVQGGPKALQRRLAQALQQPRPIVAEEHEEANVKVAEEITVNVDDVTSPALVSSEGMALEDVSMTPPPSPAASLHSTEPDVTPFMAGDLQDAGAAASPAPAGSQRQLRSSRNRHARSNTRSTPSPTATPPAVENPIPAPRAGHATASTPRVNPRRLPVDMLDELVRHAIAFLDRLHADEPEQAMDILFVKAVVTVMTHMPFREKRHLTSRVLRTMRPGLTLLQNSMLASEIADAEDYEELDIDLEAEIYSMQTAQLSEEEQVEFSDSAVTSDDEHKDPTFSPLSTPRQLQSRKRSRNAPHRPTQSKRRRTSRATQGIRDSVGEFLDLLSSEADENVQRDTPHEPATVAREAAMDEALVSEQPAGDFTESTVENGGSGDAEADSENEEDDESEVAWVPTVRAPPIWEILDLLA